ncbi:MAG: WD40 repeat domain-containing protein [Gammaproteobacteria bacterium]
MVNNLPSSSKATQEIELHSLTQPIRGPINELPLELLANIFKYLSVKDQHAFAQTSKKNLEVLRRYPQLVIAGLANSDGAVVRRALASNPNIMKIDEDRRLTTVPLLTLAKEYRDALKPKNLDPTLIERQKLLQVNTRKLFPLIKGAAERSERAVTAMVKLPGNRMASIRDHEAIKILDLDTGTVIRTLQEGFPFQRVYTLQLLPAAPDGKVLMVSSASSSIDIYTWDPDTGQRVRDLQLSCVPERFHVLPPDANGNCLLATAGSGGMKIWDLQTGALIREAHRPYDWVCAFRALPPGPDGKVMLASGLHNGSIKIWDPSTCALIHTLRGHTNFVRALEGLSSEPNGEVLLASGSIDMTIKIWNPLTGTLINTLQGHQSLVMALQALPPGPNGQVLLASGSLDNTIRIWNVKTGECLKTITTEAPVWSLMYDTCVLHAGLENGKIISMHFNGVDLEALLGPDKPTRRNSING